VSVTLPGPPATEHSVGSPHETPTLPDPDPFILPATPPARAGSDLAGIYRDIEQLRSWIVEGDSAGVRGDACGWHLDLLGYLADVRDGMADGARPLTEDTRRFLMQVADAIAQVDALSDPLDPVLAGPPPEDPERKRAWMVIRRTRMRPVERELDELLQSLRRDYVPQLQGESWPARFVGCLTACQRHFEQRGRLGERAVGEQLTRDEWAGFLAARLALQAVAQFGGPIDPPIRLDGEPHETAAR